MITLYDHLIIEWDDEKNEKNKRKHKLSFETAHLAFQAGKAVSQGAVGVGKYALNKVKGKGGAVSEG